MNSSTRNLLSFDGWGPLGYAKLIMIEQLMHRIRIEEGLEEPPRPCDRFDIIGGSGMGDIIAILLGRLKMKTQDAKEAYERISKQVCPKSEESETTMQLLGSDIEQFDSEFRETLKTYKCDANLPLMDPGQEEGKEGCKTVIFSVNPLDMKPYRIRSYKINSEFSSTCTILEAARATLICSQHGAIDGIRGQEFLAGYRFNNPVRGVIEEATKVYPDTDKVGCIISLGARRNQIPPTRGLKVDKWAFTYEPMRLLNAIGKDCENTHQEVASWLFERHIYFRFNPEYSGEKRFNLNEWDDIGTLKTSTHTYCNTIAKQMDSAVKAAMTEDFGVDIKSLRRIPAKEVEPTPHPPLVTHFYGRDDVLRDLLDHHISPTIRGKLRHFISVLVGLSGCGKTQTGLQFWERIKATNPEMLFLFVDAKSEESIQYSLQTIIRSRSPYNWNKTYKDALQWFATTKEKWLILFDGADEPDLNLAQYIPGGEQCHVIITTKNLELGSLAPNSTHHIGDLPLEACVKILLLNAEIPDDESHRIRAQEIAKELGYHALALSHAAASILAGDIQFSGYLKSFRERRKQLLSTMPTMPNEPPYKLAAYTAFDICYKQLPTKLQDIMVLFSYLDCSQISQDMIARAAKSSFLELGQYLGEFPEEDDKNICVAASILGGLFCPNTEWDLLDFKELVQPARQRSLLRSSKIKKDRPFLYMHSLVQAYLHDCSLDRKEYFQQLAARLIVSAHDDDSFFTLAVATHNQLINPHARVIPVEVTLPMRDRLRLALILSSTGSFQLAINHFERLNESTMGDYSPLASIIKGRLALAFVGAGEYSQARRLLGEALEIIESIFGKEHFSTVQYLQILGNILSNEGKYEEAAEFYDRELANVIKATGEHSMATFQVEHGRAMAYNYRGMYSQALDHLDECRKTALEWFGKESPATIVCISNISNTLQCQGKYLEAEERCKEALELLVKTLGEDDWLTLKCMGTLAAILGQQEKDKDAEGLQEKVLEMMKQILGEENPTTLDAMTNLASIYAKQGKYEDAKKWQNKVIARQKVILGDEHPKTLMAANNLAVTLYLQANWDAAEELFHQTLTARKRVLGYYHPDTLASMVNLAAVYIRKGRHGDAERLRKKIPEFDPSEPGKDHPTLLDAWDHLGISYCAQGNYKGAREIRTQILKINKLKLGEDHPKTLISTSKLAAILYLQGELAEAAKHQRLTLQIQKRVLGEEHLDTLNSMDDLSLTLADLGDIKGAVDLNQRAMEGKTRALGENHPQVLTSMNNLCTKLYALGNYAEAETRQKLVLAAQIIKLGEHHPDTFASRNTLASIFERQGKYKEAINMHETALGFCNLPKNHPQTLTIMNNLGLALSGQGRYEEAEKYQVHVLNMEIQMHGEVHPSLLISRNNLALTYRHQEKYKEAEEQYAPVLCLLKEFLGEKNEMTLTVMSNLADVLESQGEYSKAEDLYRTTVKLRKDTLGEHHPDVANSLNGLATVLHKQKKWDKAEGLYRQAMDILSKDQDHLTTLTIMSNLALTLRELKKYDEGLKLAKKSPSDEKAHFRRGSPKCNRKYQYHRYNSEIKGRYQRSQGSRGAFLSRIKQGNAIAWDQPFLHDTSSWKPVGFIRRRKSVI